MTRKATLTIATDEADTNITVEFDPPTKTGEATLCKHLACIAIKAIMREGSDLIRKRDGKEFA